VSPASDGPSGPRGPSRPGGAVAVRRPLRALEVRSAKDAVSATLAYYGISENIRAERVHTEWYDLVGPRIAQRTRPFGVVGKLLVIEVASSAWMQELNLLKPQILTGLLERVGKPALFDDIKFRLAGPTRPNQPDRRPRARATQASKPPAQPATGVARERIVREAEAVDDLELRELIARVRISNDR